MVGLSRSRSINPRVSYHEVSTPSIGSTPTPNQIETRRYPRRDYTRHSQNSVNTKLNFIKVTLKPNQTIPGGDQREASPGRPAGRPGETQGRPGEVAVCPGGLRTPGPKRDLA